MDNEEAKLILHAYRPGGEDASDPFFAEALEQARRDPGLGDWLADQRAFDVAMQGAMQAEKPPVKLRDAIMLTRKVTALPPRRSRQFPVHPGFLALAAVIVVLLAVGILQVPQFRQNLVPSLTVSSFAHKALALTTSGNITLGKMSADPGELRRWLAERGSPSQFDLPPGLQGVPGLGCQSLTFDGKKVSLMCFAVAENQIVHVFVVEESSLAGAPPSSRPVVHSTDGNAWATWTSGGKSYVMTGTNVSRETLERLI